MQALQRVKLPRFEMVISGNEARNVSPPAALPFAAPVDLSASPFWFVHSTRLKAGAVPLVVGVVLA